uniref:Uncharacterized protein n=1 Tax=Chromera velia CCMP2878 TaxID=1169474 RepID=A0A0G4G684_9ALVE|mmetsp:Transcript_24365/g.47842  ORF Transcript_24365/g.47842 Transcript_24365/m.47842 type:complete len:364 (-) Transcript_24365:163-1254(-)|eukprot:Cvel_20359.t1-p1 / transcript=Cvel_20359.t1 / gene=Cvel_20359 / organism=Chromera_velia_CCMP2878 / gene_product=hypothetical protein / transcript_product=hypothetical protein / location=Cvel_scaffold1821:10937-12264(-) / protein_length=363 / sequence_SO=supercontig / SO=protein_coding / is_pseudo=false
MRSLCVGLGAFVFLGRDKMQVDGLTWLKPGDPGFPEVEPSMIEKFLNLEGLELESPKEPPTKSYEGTGEPSPDVPFAEAPEVHQHSAEVHEHKCRHYEDCAAELQVPASACNSCSGFTPYFVRVRDFIEDESVGGFYEIVSVYLEGCFEAVSPQTVAVKTFAADLSEIPREGLINLRETTEQTAITDLEVQETEELKGVWEVTSIFPLNALIPTEDSVGVFKIFSSCDLVAGLSGVETGAFGVGKDEEWRLSVDVNVAGCLGGSFSASEIQARLFSIGEVSPTLDDEKAAEEQQEPESIELGFLTAETQEAVEGETTQRVTFVVGPDPSKSWSGEARDFGAFVLTFSTCEGAALIEAAPFAYA